MGTVLASSVISKAQVILNDVDGVRWTSAELIGWLCDGQREIIIYKPNAYIKNTPVQLRPGTLQTLPDDGVQLVDIPRNLKNGGTAPGRAIRITGRETLDATLPDWHSSDPSDVVKHYMYTELDPKRFWNYPPQPAVGMGFVDLVYGAVPPNVAADEAICLDDIYQTALLDYVLYRAFTKDTEFAADPNRATNHYSAFIASVGGKAKVEAGVNPNSTAPATSPDSSTTA